MIVNFEMGLPGRTESETARRNRIVRERAMIEEGVRDTREGRFVEGEELDAILDTFESDEPIPEPAPRFK